MCNCDDQSSLHIFLRSSNILSFIYSFADIDLLNKAIPRQFHFALVLYWSPSYDRREITNKQTKTIRKLLVIIPNNVCSRFLFFCSCFFFVFFTLRFAPLNLFSLPSLELYVYCCWRTYLKWYCSRRDNRLNRIKDLKLQTLVARSKMTTYNIYHAAISVMSLLSFILILSFMIPVATKTKVAVYFWCCLYSSKTFFQGFSFSSRLWQTKEQSTNWELVGWHVFIQWKIQTRPHPNPGRLTPPRSSQRLCSIRLVIPRCQ